MLYVKTKETVLKIIDKVKNNQHGMYLRFGDGDFNIAQNLEEMLCKPSPLFVFWMKEAMKIRDSEVMICIPHHCKELNTLEEGMYGGNHEYPLDYVKKFSSILFQHGGHCETVYTNVAFSYCAKYNPDLIIELHLNLKQKPILFIGNENYEKDFLHILFGLNVHTIYVSSRDAYNMREFVFSEFELLYKTKLELLDYFVIIMASGCSGRAFSAELYSKYYVAKKNFFLIDYGSLLDYLHGDITRAYMQLDPPEKNLILENI